jgi:hypothetical protein
LGRSLGERARSVCRALDSGPMTGELFAAIIVATRTGDWERVNELINQGHLSAAEAHEIVRELQRAADRLDGAVS